MSQATNIPTQLMLDTVIAQQKAANEATMAMVCTAVAAQHVSEYGDVGIDLMFPRELFISVDWMRDKLGGLHVRHSFNAERNGWDIVIGLKADG